jgi:transcriptional regulator with XRE-family HTH domain
MALGARIKQARELRALNQTELAERVNKMLGPEDKPLTQQALGALESRDSNKSEHALKIADALGVSVRWLLDGQGDLDALDWPFPDQELLARVLKLPRDWRVELQAVIRERVAEAERDASTPAAGAGPETNVVVTSRGGVRVRGFSTGPAPATAVAAPVPGAAKPSTKPRVRT